MWREFASAESPKMRFFCTVPMCTHEKARGDGYVNKEDLNKQALVSMLVWNKKHDHRRSRNKLDPPASLLDDLNLFPEEEDMFPYSCPRGVWLVRMEAKFTWVDFTK